MPIGAEFLNRSKLIDAEKNLKKVYTMYRTDPIAATLFDTTIDQIRVRLYLFGQQESLLAMIEDQASKITDQNERIEYLEKKLAKMAKKLKKKKAES